MRKYFLLVFLLILIPATAGLAYYDLGQPAGFVNDYAGLISPEARQDLETKLVNFEKETSNEITVVTINSLEGDTIENFAVKLFEQWGIGKKDKDNGVLVLIAKNERKMRIEVGYGLEGALTDAQSNWIIQNVMRPAFQKGDYNGGINGAVEKIIAATKGEYVPSENKLAKALINFPFSDFINVLFLIFIVFIWLGSILARSKSWWAGGIIGFFVGSIFSWLIGGLIGIIVLTLLGLLFDYLVSKNYRQSKTKGKKPAWWAGGGGFGGHSGGGFGGGFGGFGGGSSGGGGASGGW